MFAPTEKNMRMPARNTDNYVEEHMHERFLNLRCGMCAQPFRFAPFCDKIKHLLFSHLPGDLASQIH